MGDCAWDVLATESETVSEEDKFTNTHMHDYRNEHAANKKPKPNNKANRLSRGAIPLEWVYNGV